MTVSQGKHPPVGAADVIIRVSEKIGELSRLSAGLQSILAHCALPEGATDIVSELQQLDRMTQLLQDIPPLLTRIAAQLPADQTLDLDRILIGIIRGEIRTVVIGAANAEDQPVSGHVLWF